MNWLDTRTQELLHSDPPSKLAPPKTAQFGLVLLQKGMDHWRLVRAISRINECKDSVAASLARRSLPVTINADLEYGDALLGQFELICCDATAAFLNSEVLDHGDKAYLRDLFQRISESPEFKPCTLTIVDIPITEEGQCFADQFLGLGESGMAAVAFPLRINVAFKKARIMAHWGERIGVRLNCDALGS